MKNNEFNMLFELKKDILKAEISLVGAAEVNVRLAFFDWLVFHDKDGSYQSNSNLSARFLINSGLEKLKAPFDSEKMRDGVQLISQGIDLLLNYYRTL